MILGTLGVIEMGLNALDIRMARAAPKRRSTGSAKV